MPIFLIPIPAITAYPIAWAPNPPMVLFSPSPTFSEFVCKFCWPYIHLLWHLLPLSCLLAAPSYWTLHSHPALLVLSLHLCQDDFLREFRSFLCLKPSSGFYCTCNKIHTPSGTYQVSYYVPMACCSYLFSNSSSSLFLVLDILAFLLLFLRSLRPLHQILSPAFIFSCVAIPWIALRVIHVSAEMSSFRESVSGHFNHNHHPVTLMSLSFNPL